MTSLRVLLLCVGICKSKLHYKLFVNVAVCFVNVCFSQSSMAIEPIKLRSALFRLNSLNGWLFQKLANNSTEQNISL